MVYTWHLVQQTRWSTSLISGILLTSLPNQYKPIRNVSSKLCGSTLFRFSFPYRLISMLDCTRPLKFSMLLFTFMDIRKNFFPCCCFGPEVYTSSEVEQLFEGPFLHDKAKHWCWDGGKRCKLCRIAVVLKWIEVNRGFDILGWWWSLMMIWHTCHRVKLVVYELWYLFYYYKFLLKINKLKLAIFVRACVLCRVWCKILFGSQSRMFSDSESRRWKMAWL